MLTNLLDLINKSSALVVDLQTQLTALPALGPDNGGDGETLKAAWLKEHLESTLGLSVIECNAPDSRVSSGYRPNLIAQIPGKTSRTLWVISHMDVVPAGDESLWDTPPFTVTRQGDDLIGRGVEDNQQGLVSSLLVADALAKSGQTPDIGLGLMLVADEETGMTHGLPHVLHAMPDLIDQDDFILIPDIGNSSGAMVQIAEKSVLWLRFTVTGQQCHASTPSEGKNSLVAAAHCIVALNDLYAQFPARNKVFEPPYSTFVPSKKEPNVENINTMPGKDVFYVDCRILPDYPLDAIQKASQTIADKVAQELGVTITVEAQNTNPSLKATSDKAVIVQRLCQALEKDRNIKGILCGSSGQTVATILRNKGYDAVGWSTLIGNAHQPNERSSIPFTIADARVILRMLFDE